jgi:hypothetical protein
VWVAGFYNNKPAMLEYRHDGAGPIDHLALPNTAPFGCAVDPTSGDLAVANSQSQNGSLTVYRKAKGSGKTYFDANIKTFLYCAYDSEGNLLGQGRASGTSFEFTELVKGGKQLEDVNFGALQGEPGGVQWDGSYFVIGYNGGQELYRYSIAHFKATFVGETPLNAGGFYLRSFALQGKTAVAVLSTDNNVFGVATFAYPKGSRAKRHHVIGESYGVTVSVASSN